MILNFDFGVTTGKKFTASGQFRWILNNLLSFWQMGCLDFTGERAGVIFIFFIYIPSLNLINAPYMTTVNTSPLKPTLFLAK